MKPLSPPRPLILVDEVPRAGQPAEALLRMWLDLEQLAVVDIQRPEPALVPVERPIKVRYSLD